MKSIDRGIEPQIEHDLARKMVFVGGPRQCGKTTLAKRMFARLRPNDDWREWYFNWDSSKDREALLRDRIPDGPGMLVLDEVHKYSRWRNLVKGLFDTRRDELSILVTGSAMLDYYRRGGDSLQGRYHYHRLHPLTLRETKDATFAGVSRLLRYGGFPEPYLAESDTETRRWSREHRQRVLRGDLPTLEQVKDVALVEQLCLRLPDLVGSPLSINSLREDLQVAHPTVARWLEILERLYAIFRVYPFGAPKLRAVKKEAKHYHFDWTVVTEEGARFENLVGLHLLIACHHLEDIEGHDAELRYFRDTDKREVDFVVVKDRKPVMFVECKLKDGDDPQPLVYLKRKFPQVDAILVSLRGERTWRSRESIRHVPAHTFLAELPR